MALEYDAVAGWGFVTSLEKFHELACLLATDTNDPWIVDNFAELLWQKFRVHRDVCGGAHVFLAIPSAHEFLQISKAVGHAVEVHCHDSSAEREKIAKENLVSLIGADAAEQWKYGFWLFGYSS